MADMLVKLCGLPSLKEILDHQKGQGIEIRRAMAYERWKVADWISTNFNAQWAEECKTAFSGHPVGCYIALKEKRIIGFCCIDCTFKGFAGPIGVGVQLQGQGIGRALLVAALNAMQALGYGYAVIGEAGVPEFFGKAAGAIEIKITKPSLYPSPIA